MKKMRKSFVILNAVFNSGNVRNSVNMEMYFCFVGIRIVEFSGSFKLT